MACSSTTAAITRSSRTSCSIPELIDQVNVNFGSTDVDSPTASAVGGTVNYPHHPPAERAWRPHNGFAWRIRLPPHLRRSPYRRDRPPWGTRAFVSASTAKNDNPFNNYSKIDKQQYNARIYQPLGDNGDFVSVAGHYNQNRNNFFGSLPLRQDRTQSATNLAPRNVGGLGTQRFPRNADEREY